MKKSLLIVCLYALSACRENVDPVGPVTTCVSVPQILPDPIPGLTKGEVLRLNVRATCTGPALFVWRLDNSSVASLNVTVGDTVRLTAIANGVVKLMTYWAQDTTYRATATVVVRDSFITSSAASYKLETVAGQPLPYAMQLTGPDIRCVSNHTSQGVFDTGTLTFDPARTHQFTFAWTRYCIAFDGTRDAFSESSVLAGTYVLQGDSVFLTQSTGETWKGVISGTEFRLTFRLPPNTSGFPDNRSTPTTALVYRRQ